MNDATLILISAGLVVLAGFFAASDAAVSTVSRARAGELARERLRGARALQTIAADPARYTNLLLLLRLVCELTATTLVALVLIDAIDTSWVAALITAGTMAVVSFVVVGVGPRTIGRQHAYSVGRFAAPLVLWLGRALGPLATLLIRIGNAFTPGQGLPRGPVRDPGRAARAGRPGRAARRGRARRARHDPLGLRPRRHHRPRGHGPPDRDGGRSRRASRPARRSRLALRVRLLPAAGDRRDASTTCSAWSTSRTSCAASRPGGPTLTVGEVMRAGHLRAGVQARRRAAAGDAGGPHPHGDRGRRVRRDRRPGHHRGHPRGDRRRDHRRVRRGAAAGRVDRGRTRSGSPPGCRSRTSASCSTSSWTTTEVETVAGLLAQALGRVPIPGASATVGELTLEAEGTTGRRNRIDTVLVTRQPAGAGRPTRGEADRRCLNCPRGAGRRGRQAGDPGPGGPGPDRRGRGRGRARPGRPDLRRRHGGPAVAAPVRAAGRGGQRRVGRCVHAGGRRGRHRRTPLWTPTGSAAVRDLGPDAPVHVASSDGTSR